MKTIILSAVVIALNEEKNIGDCLASLAFADEIIVVDTGSADKTVEIAKNNNAKVINTTQGSYKDWRTKGLESARGEWVMYVDTDERVTPLLRKEVVQTITSYDANSPTAYAIPRKNIILGHELKHGGWWPDYVIRLFIKAHLSGWKNELHEEPIYSGDLGYLNEPLTHLKHNNLEDMVTKTNKWSLTEAKLLYDSHHPKMVWWRFFRIMATEAWLRIVKEKAFLDGSVGILYALYQVWSRFITYAKLWELQHISRSQK